MNPTPPCRRFRNGVLTGAAMAILISPVLRAEEGAVGHYVPGATSSFIDALPGKPAWVVADAFTYYDGNASADRSLPIAGLTTFGAEATIYANTVLGIYQTALELLGGNYAVAAAFPWVSLEVNATVVPSVGPSFLRTDSVDGIGDITFYPFMLGWTHGPDIKYDVRLGVYAPTGDYDVGEIANAGRNHWTVEPSASFSWLSTKIGTEGTVFAGFDINTENPDTDYTSGTSFHLEATLAQHLPVGKLGIVGIGANAFYYQQISGDHGAGAELGDFEGRTVGVGPVVSFVRKIGSAQMAAEVKWLPELEVEKRMKGDYVWFKIGVVF